MDVISETDVFADHASHGARNGTVPFRTPVQVNKADRALAILLRCIAAAAVLAVVPVFMPHAWMDACHRWLGLGELPERPVIAYLTRSLSAMYVFHGGLLWLVARDVRRYAALVTYLGAAFMAFGAVSLWIDARAGLPWFWIASEGPFGLVLGPAVLLLQRKSVSAEE
jgi:hypothetical protein